MGPGHNNDSITRLCTVEYKQYDFTIWSRDSIKKNPASPFLMIMIKQKGVRSSGRQTNWATDD